MTDKTPVPMHVLREGRKDKGWPTAASRRKDQAYDRAHSIKEGSWEDKAIDAAAKRRARK
jgi:hypothetical protein